MCDCFTCKNHDKPELCIAYYKGYIEACEWFLSWAKANKIKMGCIGKRTRQRITKGGDNE